ncbi:hypothetical protein M8756_03270 [Lutimaribacter sp. EGI FJ00015]|uniref:Uncharacterized protein n=1 Tax=Lutimaribacter degradans TaxID=2945989 RepID=A0ACC5ZSI1_9RHOB|nr:hypothetical protein [Lutimaribacter sp. EGI FJ00013]MCM2560736.1 hypothetical protein [Lutimaribacter sp. EGI FJ00013]MCO0612318.1 hypothetical protein [Lutimaribacter sp. EGI FJ00015]MCO0634561.1 hypothetical protein [Lutimaribacter sp. EGI FJ00014]
MVSIPLPVRFSWYAYHVTATAMETQLRMTHAMWMAMLQAHPLAPHDLKKVEKVVATPASRSKAAKTRKRATKPKTAKRSPAAGPESPAPGTQRRRRAPSAPPQMPSGRFDA